MIDMDERGQKETQEKLILYQLLQKHLEELRQQTMLLESRVMEIGSTKQALGDAKKITEKNEILIPLGNGCYTHGKIVNSKKILMDIGSGIIIPKENHLAIRLLEGKEKEARELAEDLQKEMSNTMNKMNELGPELERALAVMNKEK